MSRESANHAFRQIRTLFTQGAVGGLTDAQLVDRFLDRDASGREDAFAALVQRHGPMVWSVCRRMLGGAADADDAFQAVFLVLARKARTLRRVDALKPWLYGVAARTAKEARRRAARRLAREGGVMDESKVVSAPMDDHADLLPLLDEEIDRLPVRFRELILLCDLEGVSRQHAAAQLGLPEGTVSSRLARGRALLRDRLTRRGVTLGTGLAAGLMSEPASAALPDRLADQTVRLALDFASGGAAAGTVPAAVKSLAEGVIRMISVTKMAPIVGALMALGASAGIALAVVPKDEEKAPATPAPAAITQVEKKEAEKPLPATLQIRGGVVDENGRPEPGAEVRAASFATYETRGVTGPDGSFAIPAPLSRIDGHRVLARSADGDRLGVFLYGFNLTKEAAATPLRIVLKPASKVAVKVTDANQAPIAGAGIEVVGGYSIIAAGKTGADGQATLAVPSDSEVNAIVAMKPRRGFDFAEYGEIGPGGRAMAGIPAETLPASVPLVLDGGRTARIKAVDRDDKPLAGVPFAPWLLRKEGRQMQLNYSSGMLAATTGPDGIATFDWLPAWDNLLQLWPLSREYAHRRIVVKEGETGVVTTKLFRNETLRGRVTHADGSPAPGIQVRAVGSGQGLDSGQASARTSGDGSYEMQLPPNEGYAVYIDDPDWTAPTRLDVMIREGQPAAGVDFTLIPGTIVRGTVTVGSDNRPVPGQRIVFFEKGGQAPEEFREPGDRFSHLIQRQSDAYTDNAGRYSIRLGPGEYTVLGPVRTENQKFTLKDEPEKILDYHLSRPEKGPIAGRVAYKGKGVAGASVELVAATSRGGIPFTVKTDPEGRFQTQRQLDRNVIHARNADGTLGAIVEIGAEDPEVTIELAPTATATGILLDENGKPAANMPLEWGRRVLLDNSRTMSMTLFAPKVATDAEGHFTLPSLVVGQAYDIALERNDGHYLAAGRVQPENADPIDLGTLKAGAYRAPELADINREEMSSFDKDAPDTGHVAPPIEATTLDGKRLTLDDFKGKYVLLDFWATWCGPCIKEIPQLQSVHDAFGKDERFVILSLSVDEKIDQPKEFQETRKLPWMQAFVGEGVHGPIPQMFGIRAIPAFVLIGPDGKIVARGMRGEEIKESVSRALATP